MARPLPSRLLTPPVSAVSPPIATRVQKLPYEDISWQAFEQLCLRLAQKESRIEDWDDVRPYGVQGDDQAGIDLFARLPASGHEKARYRTYQCKNEKDFGPAKIKAAVRLFRKGKWRAPSQEFVLCTRESLAGQRRSDEVELQKRVLEKAGIRFTTWDAVALDRKMKGAPELVDEFFGPDWVRLFCGEDAARELRRKRPLTPDQMRELRASLRDFYRRLFHLYDPSLPGESLKSSLSLPLEKRFVVPNIENDTEFFFSREGEEKSETSSTFAAEFENRPFEDEEDKPLLQNSAPAISSEMKTRRPLESWLVTTARSVVLGDAGSGKSTLSRFLALDLLADEPRFSQLRDVWNGAIPVWLPFGLWTQRISHDPTQREIALSQVLEDWFHRHDETRLWELVKQALEDERLILIVDGLDEWSDEAAARVALRHLQIFVERRQIPTVVTGRPYGFSRLSMPLDGWQIGHLTSFEPAQQEELVGIWLSHFLGLQEAESGQATPSDEAKAARLARMTREFMAQIAASPDIRDLAGNPLLLCLLLGLNLHRKHLPSNRFHAYFEAIRSLIEDHPRRRADATGVSRSPNNSSDGSPDLSDGELRSVFAFLAFQLQTNQSQGTVETDVARRWVEEFLRDEDRLGLDSRAARAISRALVEVGDDATGLLVRKSPRDVGFYHRSFQEYLAAEHLLTLPERQQLQFIEERACDPQWPEVILAFSSRQNQAERFRTLVETLERVESRSLVTRSLVNSYWVLPLLAEIAFGHFECPAKLARGIAERVFDRIEMDALTPFRGRLLHQAMNGLRSARLQGLVVEKLSRYFPFRRGVWSGFYRAMGQWPRSEEVETCLFSALFHEASSSRLAAAFALAQLCGGDTQWGDKIAFLAQSDWRAPVRAAALACLRLGWPEHPKLEALAQAGQASADVQLRYESILARITSKQQTHADRRALWDIVTTREFGHWHDADGSEISDIFLRGWPNCAELQRECLLLARRLRARKTLRKGDAISAYGSAQFTAHVVAQTLVKGFSLNDEVAQCLAGDLEEEWRKEQDKERKGQLLLHDFHGDHHQLLRKQPSHHPLVLQALDIWLSRPWKHKPRGWSEAALLCPTPERKQHLLESAAKFSSPLWPNHPAELLLEGWGLEDDEVRTALEGLAWGEAVKASAIGEILPRVIPDACQCRARILEILRDPECENFAALLQGLAQLKIAPDDSEIIDALFSRTGPFARYGTRYFSDHWSDSGPDREKWPSRGEIERVLKRGTDEVEFTALNWDAFFDNYRSRDIVARLFTLFPAAPRVRDLAFLLLQRPEGEFADLALSFKEDATMREALLALASPLPASLRRQVIARVRDGSGDAHFDWEMARLATFDHDSQVRAVGSLLFHRALQSAWNGALPVPPGCILPQRETVIEKLHEGMAIWGTASFRRHETDFIGLLVLDRLDLVRETQPDGLKFQFLSQNPALVEIMVEHWSQIKRDLGKNPFVSKKGDHEESYFWEIATILAAPHPAARTAAIRYCRTEEQPNCIFQRGDALLQLMAQLGDRDGVLEAFSQTFFQERAAVVMARFFGGDSGVLERLAGSQWRDIKEKHRNFQTSGLLPAGDAALHSAVASRPEIQELDDEVWKAGHTFPLEVLWEGWPFSEEAHIFVESARRQSWNLRRNHWFLIGEHFATPVRLLEQFKEFLQLAPELEHYELNPRPILRALQRRLRTDENLRSLFLAELRGQSTSHEKINLARLLLQTPPTAGETHDWITAEIEHQHQRAQISPEPMEEGFDLTAKRLKPVAVALLELVV